MDIRVNPINFPYDFNSFIFLYLINTTTTFSEKNTRSVDYTIVEGDVSARLDITTIALAAGATLQDAGGNAPQSWTPNTTFTANKDITGFDTYLLIGSDERNEETITTRGQGFGERAALPRPICPSSVSTSTTNQLKNLKVDIPSALIFSLFSKSAALVQKLSCIAWIGPFQV